MGVTRVAVLMGAVLATDQIRIAMGIAGTDGAMENAKVVLMSDNLNNIVLPSDASRRAQCVVAHAGNTVLRWLNGLILIHTDA